ncbi:sensor domain-containing diguanylate cyclase [Leucobacter sp. USHLN153]|uniref:sensor domain-containing diguanylate cyclase n=1 Tax=Leucobacter sp. USHLN153 TaxID=3081268 RepID=UPI0030193D17
MQGKLGEPAASETLPNGAAAFTTSAERVVAYLQKHTPLTDWSVSRVTNGEQIHVHVQETEVISSGARISWDESFCSRMSAGAAHVVRDSLADPDYSDLRFAERIGSYAGYTIHDDRGELFGVLCGARTTPLETEETIDEELIRLLSELLSTQLELSRRIDRERRSIAIADALAHSDALTGLLNRRGWDRVVADAQERVDAFGDPVAVAILDLNGLKSVNDSIGHSAGDGLLERTGVALKEAAGPEHRVARIGGDEFAILANGVSPRQVPEHFERFTRRLEAAGISASLGGAASMPGRVTLREAIDVADAEMYARKQAARAS